MEFQRILKSIPLNLTKLSSKLHLQKVFFLEI